MYDMVYIYDVEDEFDGEVYVSTVREEKEFDTWEEAMAYRDELRSCPWISNITVVDQTPDFE